MAVKGLEHPEGKPNDDGEDMDGVDFGEFCPSQARRDRVGKDLLDRVGVLCGKCDGDIVFVVLLMDPVHLGVVHHPVHKVERQLLRNQENEKLPKDCLHFGDRCHVHVNSKVHLCADEGEQRSDNEDIGGNYFKRSLES